MVLLLRDSSRYRPRMVVRSVCFWHSAAMTDAQFIVFSGLAALAIATLYEKTHPQIAGALRMIGGVFAFLGLFWLAY